MMPTDPTGPAVVGIEPSPFDPAPWPPWDRVAAAGLGAFYGATIRRLDGTRDTASDAVAFGTAQIEEAVAGGTITAADATRLIAYITPNAPGATGTPVSAASLFQEALDDRTSSPLTIAILSVAAVQEDEAGADLDDWHHGYLTGILVTLEPSAVLAVAVASHVHVTWR